MVVAVGICLSGMLFLTPDFSNLPCCPGHGDKCVSQAWAIIISHLPDNSDWYKGWILDSDRALLRSDI